jgi:hypothetical protein
MIFSHFLNNIENQALKEYNSKILMKVRHFLTTTQCRRTILIEYFETDIDKPPKVSDQKTTNQVYNQNCCDNCTRRLKAADELTSDQLDDELKDFTEDAFKLLSVVKLLNQRYGLNLVISFLLGSVNINLKLINYR